ncbi:hypothetical protein EMCRGX_G001862 [Ephydatia muelleri]
MVVLAVAVVVPALAVAVTVVVVAPSVAVMAVCDAQRMQYLSFHSKPAASDDLHSHSVTKSVVCWEEGSVTVVSFLHKDQKEEDLMDHYQAVERADLFRQNYCIPEARIDARLLSQQGKQANENKEILRHIVMAVEFLAKQGLSFRGHRDDRVDFGVMDDNKGNFIATLQLMAKDNSILQKHLLNASKNAKYTCKSIQIEIIHIYGSKIKSNLTDQLREQRLSFTIIADECTDSYSNQEVLSVCLRFVDLSSFKDPHIKECFIGFIHLDRTNASTISKKILECISESPLSLDSSLIRELVSSAGSWDWDQDTIVKAQGMKSALSSFQTIAVFIITKNILDMVKSLAIKLQQKDQDVLDAYRMIDEVVQGIRYTRANIDENFHFWYADILELADNVGAFETVPRKTAIMKNRSNTPSDSVEEHYKRTVAIPLLDNLSAQMDQRFNGEDRHARSLLSLVPSIFLESSVNPDEYIKDMLKWEKHLQYPKSLGSEVRRWNGLWMNIKVSGNSKQKSEIPKTILEALGAIDRDSFPNIHFLLVVGCTLPISSAEAERSFSLMRRIKTYARSVMTEERFSDLALISMHYKERVSVDEICKAFVQAHPRKLFQASLFDDCST